MQQDLKVKNENYFIISGFMVNKLGLKGNSLMVFAIIYGFSQDNESYFCGSRQYLCDFIGATKRTIDACLNELIEKNYIIKVTEKITDVIHNKYKVNPNVVNCTTGVKIALGGEKVAPNNIEDNINNKQVNNKKEILKKEIFDFWNEKQIVVHREINEKIDKALTKALTKYTIEQIKESIENYNKVLKDKSYYFDYTWTLDTFLSQKNTLGDFLEDGVKWINYKQNIKGANTTNSSTSTKKLGRYF